MWYLEGTLNNGESWIVPINKKNFLIGRNEECDLILASDTVSRRHPEILTKENELIIHDLNSKNGTMINEKILQKNTKLLNGDIISFGKMKFQVMYKIQNDNQAGTIFINSPRKENNFVNYYYLTKREEDILYHLMQGKSTEEISKILFISKGTAKNHILNIFKKTNVHSKFELFALYNNFISKK